MAKKKIDPYEVLGVDKNADTDKIKKAHRKKAKATHPDMGGDAEKFDDVQRSYLILINPERRKRFDETGEEGAKANNEESAVATLLSTTLLATMMKPVTNGAKLRNHDIVRQMKEKVQADIKADAETLKKIREALEMLEDAGNRMNDPSGILTATLKKEWANAKGAENSTIEKRSVAEAALEYLKHCKFKLDAPKPPKIDDFPGMKMNMNFFFKVD